MPGDPGVHLVPVHCGHLYHSNTLLLQEGCCKEGKRMGREGKREERLLRVFGQRVCLWDFGVMNTLHYTFRAVSNGITLFAKFIHWGL